MLSVEDALDFLRQTFDPRAVELPFIVEREAYAVDRSHPIFESLRADYPGWDDWFERCAHDHRKCWVVEVGGEMAGIIVRKDETNSEDGIVSPGRKVLKLCTFIMATKYRGEKFGEHFLKQSLWFAQTNRYNVVYLTAFADKEELISLLQAYGFKKTRRNDNGELFFEKVMRYGPLNPEVQADFLTFDRNCYPRFYDGVRVAKFCVPIQGPYHEKLFPEISFHKPLPLFPENVFGRELTASLNDERTPGNTIRKVYLCRAQSKRLQPGELLFFYMSKDQRLEKSQCMTTVGIIERMVECSSAEDLIRFTAKRSVFSAAELKEMQAMSPSPIKVINFLLAGHATPPVPVHQLI